MSASVLNRSIRPRRKSLTRGWVILSIFANSACVICLDSISFCTLIIKSARTSRCSASPAENPMSRNTFPLDRVTFSFIVILPLCRLLATSLLDQRTKTVPSEIRFSLWGFSRALFKSMQDIDSLRKLRHVENAMLKAGVDTNFLNTGTHGTHWFPIIRLQTLLDATQLESCNTARVPRKSSKIATGRREPNQRLVHTAQYLGISIPRQMAIRSSDMVRSRANMPPNVLARADKVIR